MDDKTKADYRKLATHFYASKLNGEQPTPGRLTSALRECAEDYRPAYWRRLRNAIAFDQRERGFAKAVDAIKATKNPATAWATGRPKSKAERGGLVKAKRRQVRAVSVADEAALAEAAATDTLLLAALSLAKQTGARPAEMARIRVEGGGRFTIQGAKKTESRGADRTIIIEDQDAARAVAWAAAELRGANIGAVQDRLARLTKKLWPKRKSRPTLYSYRHQVGGNLKKSGMDRRTIAYLMGHKSTASVDSYGDPRAASSGGGGLMRADEAGLKAAAIRENHEPSLSAQAQQKTAQRRGPEPDNDMGMTI